MRRAFLSIFLLAGCSSAEGDSSATGDPVEDSGAADVDLPESTSDVADDTAADSIATDTAKPDTGPSLDRSKCKASPDALGQTARSITGMSYVSYVPASYDKTKASPLLLALHGAGDTAANYLAAIWKSNADARNFIVLAPDGSSALGSGNTWNTSDGDNILATLDDLEACYSIDTKRVVIDGFSAGGIFAYAIGLQVAEQFSGISIASSNLGSAEALSGMSLLPAKWKIPVSHHHGTTDMNFPIDTARAGRDKLIGAGHVVHWHEFDGGHTTTAAFALVRWDDLAASVSP
ncbi:MAG: alpha/beta hydrolase family esterase [Polyangiales bacterium]